ncbi:MAG: phosphoribosylformylglycinamidine synthase subunit PurL [Alphaproteobacteria bacterium]|nr:phosphoribosylformylglycinamidine synthase subunit PurL [Alphaproteobacteria bacterium]
MTDTASHKPPAITPQVVAAHGLKPDEYDRIVAAIGRPPNLVELGVFSVMWSEHCSYKSSKKWLRQFPTTAPWVICGPGENAGVVDIGDGQAVVFKMESHNHPSFIEPYQGAATGVGGILRDVFTMGARPIANLNALRFGDPQAAKMRHLVGGVVAGIGGYGNCVGVPTVGGECTFDSAYNGNILVNAMTVGLARADRIFYARAAGVGNPVVYVGAKTGRDGIHGATMASAEFDETSEEKRPTVQVGDPFTEKLLLEACLELMATNAIVAIQDMGAAGLTSSSFEMAARGGVGIELDLSSVPTREHAMTPYEIMLSESQERMLLVLAKGREAEAAAIFRKWELDFAVVGRVTESKKIVATFAGETVLDLPVEPLADKPPLYDRPWTTIVCNSEPVPASPPGIDIGATLKRLLATPDLASKRWIWEQYDHMVMADTIARPGGDAAVVRVHGTTKGLALSSDCTPRYCYADPEMGGRQAVAECWRNLTAVGARPLAITDCLNFGNPERPEIMGELVGCIAGMAEACRALDFPVVSGNVSLYNETSGVAVKPTPQVGGVGLLDDLTTMMRSAFGGGSDSIILIGETFGHLGASLCTRLLAGRDAGPPPRVDLVAERRNGDFVRKLIDRRVLTACHDVSDGGLLVALAEMALGGHVGAVVAKPVDAANELAFWFGEDQARYILTCKSADADAILAAAGEAQVRATKLGSTGGRDLTVKGTKGISLSELQTAHEGWFPTYMAAPNQ